MIWISHENKCIFFKYRKGCLKVEFDDSEKLNKYIFSKILDGYLIG